MPYLSKDCIESMVVYYVHLNCRRLFNPGKQYRLLFIIILNYLINFLIIFRAEIFQLLG